MSLIRPQDMLRGCLPDIIETNKMFTGKESISVSNIYKYIAEKTFF